MVMLEQRGADSLVPMKPRTALCFLGLLSVAVAVPWDCCDPPVIVLDLNSEHELVVNNTVFVRVTEDLTDVRWPFHLEGHALTLKQCVDFTHKRLYTLQSGYAGETTVHYQHYCDRRSARGSAVTPRGFSFGPLGAALLLSCWLWPCLLFSGA